MKKFILMFVMLLGSVATMQAQTFDFSCANEVEIEAFFSPEEIVELMDAGFSEGSQWLPESQERVADPSYWAMNIQITQDSGNNPGQSGFVKIDASSDDYVVSDHSLFSEDVSDFDAALALARLQALSIDPSVSMDDDDRNSFSNAEEVILISMGFNESTTADGELDFGDYEGLQYIVGEELPYQWGGAPGVPDFATLLELIAYLGNN